MKKRILQGIIVFLFTVALSVSGIIGSLLAPLPVVEENVEEEKNIEENPISICLDGKEEVYVTVLGDSIAKGYSPSGSVEIKPYGNLVMEQLSNGENYRYYIENYAENGLDSVKMNDKILTDTQVYESLQNSDMIFITVGSNDLLNECKNSAQEILETDTKFKSVGQALDVLGESVEEHPLLVFKVIEAIQEWDYLSFERQWVSMMETICELKKEDTWIVVTNIYNPVTNLELPSTMNLGVEKIIQNMNQIIERHAQEYRYQIADVFHSDVYEHVQDDGVHPDQTGQKIIADKIYQELKGSERQ